MNKEILVVPSGIRYISDWKDYNLDNYQFPHILNKTITGCGFTEYCINNYQNLILISPRKMLLENKKKQHPELYYFKNEFEKYVNFDSDVSYFPKSIKSGFSVYLNSTKGLLEDQDKIKSIILESKEKLKEYVIYCAIKKKPCKIIVTYDSFRHVKETLNSIDVLSRFQVVVDEFQSFMIDAKFKSDTELEVLYQLQDLQKVCFVSATPMLDKYLDFLDEFKNLPYFEMDWESAEPGRVIKSRLEVKYIKRSLNEEMKKVINQYLSGKFERFRFLDPSGIPAEIESKEATFFVNSVRSICTIIKTIGLSIDQCNILCARTSENEEKVRKAFGLTKKDLSEIGISSVIGSIPGRGEAHKMFTFCTRTVYLGADFYSTNSRTFVFSDSNIDCLSVDISMDLEQILGRQRLDENPWKNSATLFVKVSDKVNSPEEFREYINQKIEKTNDLLRAYNNNSGDIRIMNSLAETYEYSAKTRKYQSDYVAVNRHSGKIMVPVFNNLMLVSEQRTFEIQQIDYRDRFTVFNSIKDRGLETTSEIINSYLSEFNSITTFEDKLKYIQKAELELDSYELELFLDQIEPRKFKDYYKVFGSAKLKALKYREADILKEWNSLVNNFYTQSDVSSQIYMNFIVGNSYSSSEVKKTLKRIYEICNYQKTPKATDLSEYFETKETKIVDSEGKKSRGIKLLNKKL